MPKMSQPTPQAQHVPQSSRSSVNLRSGPGTGYSVLGYGYLNENYVVGGRNPENNWIVVGTDSGSAWMALTGVNLQGACDALTVFNIPLRDATGCSNHHHDPATVWQ